MLSPYEETAGHRGDANVRVSRGKAPSSTNDEHCVWRQCTSCPADGAFTCSDGVETEERH